ncbi:MAG: hypothetical protein AAFX10_06900 [Pseudomonadota bacterium]
MSNIGKFLEFSVHTDDILESLSFYKLLGFTERETSDAWSHKYAVVSDGVLSIGLHEREFDAPALTFVKPNLTKRARKMSDGGIDFSYLQLGDEAFNELRFNDRDRNPVMMVEARTYMGDEDEDNDSVLGTWFELSLPSKDAVRGAHFWAPLAPVILNVREEPTMHMRFDAGGIPVGLSESIALEGPSLCFRCPDRTALNASCERHGFELEMYPGYEGAFAVMRSPDGIALYLYDEDFLGEGIVVEESSDLSAFKDIVPD